MFFRLLDAEARKMREPMTLLALFGAPGLIGALTFLGAASREVTFHWNSVFLGLNSVWTLLLFPMSVIAFATFVAQLEHRGRLWDHLLTLPAPKWQVFAAKSTVVALAGLAAYPLYVAFAVTGGTLGGLISPLGQFGGAPPLASIGPALAWSAAASLLLIAVQFWVSLRFSQFIVPVVVGVGGCVVMLASDMFSRGGLTKFFPWGLPAGALNGALAIGRPPAPPPEGASQAQLAAAAAANVRAAEFADVFPQVVTVGVAGGLIAFVALCVHMSRREFR